MPSRLRALAALLLVAFFAVTAVASAAPVHRAHGHGHGHKKHSKKSHHRKHAGRERRSGHRRPVTPAPVPAPSAPSSEAPAPAPSLPPAQPAPAPAPAQAPNATPTSSGSCAAANTMPTADNVAAIRAAVLCLVNQQRANAGLAALSDNGQLQAAAQGHSDDMVARGYFSHTSLDGRDFAARIQAAGYRGSAIAENIAWGSGSLATPAQIVEGWMNSAGHRTNILNGTYRDSGIGVAIGSPNGGGGATYTHDFGAH